jgi:hypothetical protein
VKEKPERIPPEERAGFRSYEVVTWRDLDNKEHQQYVVRQMKDGPGFEIINTIGHTDYAVQSNFPSAAAAHEYMRKNPAP